MFFIFKLITQNFFLGLKQHVNVPRKIQWKKKFTYVNVLK